LSKGRRRYPFVQELKGLSFPGALRYLGIQNGNPKEVNDKEAKKRNLVKAFNQWCTDYYDYLPSEYRILNRMVDYIKTVEDFETYASVFWEISTIEYQLDVLLYGDDFEKYQLFQVVTRGNL